MRSKFGIANESPRPSVNLFFRRIEYLAPGSLEIAIRMLASYNCCVVAFNSIQYDEYTVEVNGEYSVDMSEAYSRLGVFVTYAERVLASNRLKICPSALSFPSSYLHLNEVSGRKNSANGHSVDAPLVDTIIRFHAGGDLSLLAKALFSLRIAEGGIIVRPLVACQDLDEKDIQSVYSIIDKCSWPEEARPKLIHFRSSLDEPDCRSRMLNEALRHVDSEYFAFLDYDDYVFPDAYAYLAKRIEQTQKDVVFGRVYVASFDYSRMLIEGKRKEFDYGYSYADYIRLNHAPIHSFLLRTRLLGKGFPRFVVGMKYMEDYLLTLQLFTKDNCDWDSLVMSRYIGDYVYARNSSALGTLSLDESSRDNVLANEQYIECERIINKMRDEISQQ